MTDDIRFHVVLCSHNGVYFIEEQIASILDQGEAIETVHIHDFGSVDGTRALLDRLERAAEGRLNLTYHKDAPGAAASFLRALRLTLPALTDRSLVFLADQDDVWLPNKLATIAAEVSRRSLNPGEPFVLFHDVRVVDDTLQMMRPTYYTGNPFRVPRDLNRSRLLMANPAIGHTMLLSPPLVKLIANWPAADRYLMHDWLAILIASRLGRVEQIPRSLSLYRQHDSNILGAYRTRGGFASISRLLRFMNAMIWQAVSFARAVQDVRSPWAIESSTLERPCRRGYRSAAFALSAGAVLYGPTWQRKAIGLLLLIRAIIGPAAGDAERERS